jgi:hypothetical protein
MAKEAKTEGEPTVDEVAAQVFAAFLANARDGENDTEFRMLATRAYSAAEAFVAYRKDKKG